MMHNLLAALMALVSGAAMSVAVSGVWVALHIPARLQERFRLRSSWSMTFAMCGGLILAALGVLDGFSLGLPACFGIAAMLLGGTFVGMLSSALGEILQAVPVMTHRLHLSGRPFGFRLAMMAGKGIGAVLAGLMFTM